MNNNALILLWKGSSLPDYLVKRIAEVLTTNGVCIPEMLTIKYKDEESVTNALLRDITTTETPVRENNVAEAVKHAVVYIGTRFESTLNATDLTSFAIALSIAFQEEKHLRSFNGVGSTYELYNAVEILATTVATIPQSLARKYHFTQRVCDIIKKIYKTY